jgi:hypothetical protein
LVKQGLVDVSRLVMSGSYRSPVLAPGAKVDLKATWTLHVATSCTDAGFGFIAFGDDGSVTQTTHLPYAA